MRRCFWFISSLFLAACSTPSQPVSTGPAVPAAVENSAACHDDGFCTREYLPTSCMFSGQSFDGSNPCEAKKLARRFACEKNLPFPDGSVQCTPKPEQPLAVARDCSQRTFCTEEMDPHSCAFNGTKFKGNNRCEAMKKVRVFACEQGLTLNEKSLICEPVKGRKGKAG